MASNVKERDKSTSTASPQWPPEFIEQVAACVVPQIAALLDRPAKRLLDVAETADYLGRTKLAIREMLRAGKLRACKIDGRKMFDRNDLDALIDGSKG